MSKLDDLIKEKCPNGVKYSTIGEVCDKVFTGGTPSTTRSDFYDGNIPWLRSGEINFNVITKAERNITEAGLNGSSAKWIRPKSVLIAMTGATVARSGVNEIALTANQSVCAMEPSKQINYKFLYYFVSNNYEQIKGSAQGALTSINLAIIKQIRVPVPPLEIQNEIVQILDNFAELTAELTAELSNRKKQYEYYRDLLLNFDENEQRAKYVSLGDCCKMIVGGDIPKDAFSKTESSDFHIPILSNGIGDNAIYGYTNRARVTDACVTFSARGTIGYSALREKPFFPIVRLICAVPDINVLTPKYLYYVSQTLTFQVPKSGIPQLTVPMLSKYKIPIPSLEEQNRIAQVLERFDKITTDISEGLPAEIEAREKQYIYYRDKLLSFKELASNA